MGSKANMTSPVRVVCTTARDYKFAAVYASPLCHMSLAVLQYGQIYVWGQCRSQPVLSPLATRFSSPAEAFVCMSNPPITPGPVDISRELYLDVANSVSLAYNDPSTADFTINVDGCAVYVHKAILRIRCQYFRNMLGENWAEGNMAEFHVQGYKASTYKAFLQFLYTDSFDLQPEDCISLLDLANTYCEEYLKSRCEQVIKQGITVDNAARLLTAAINFNAADLEEFCFRFCMSHMTRVVQSQSFKDLDDKLVKEFISKAAVHGAFRN